MHGIYHCRLSWFISIIWLNLTLMISFGRSLVVAVFSAVAEYIACPCTTRRASTLAWACKVDIRHLFINTPTQTLLAFCD